MGSRSSSRSRTSNRSSSNVENRTITSNVNETTNTTNVHTEDNRDLSDNRHFDITDSSVDKRAVLTDATQILDSVYVNIDPSDETLRATVAAWERQAAELLSARRFDQDGINRLLSEVLAAANDGIIAVNDAHYAQLQSWQGQLQAGIDFAEAALDTGARLIASAGDRQQEALDTGARLVASAGDRQQEALDTGARLVDRAGQRAENQHAINTRLVAAVGDRQQDVLDTGARLVAAVGREQRSALDVGADLIDRAGDRQDRVTGEILDLARGTLGQTSNVQVRLITWALIGAAVIVFAGNWRAA